MTRSVVLLLVPLIWLSGCGKTDAPRFIPATGNEPVASPGRPAGDQASPDATIPKNIETH